MRPPPHPLMIEIGQRLKARRKHLRLTQGEVAGRVFLSRAVLSHYERGASPVSAAMLIALARALGVSVGYLAGERDEDAEESDDLSRRVSRLPPASRRLVAALVAELESHHKPVQSGAG